MSGVPYTFGTATTSIPLSNLDSNFVTPVTICNASVALGNTITTIGNLTLTNPTIIGGTSNISSTSITNGTSNVTILSSGGAVNIATNGTTAITVDTSQNVGIGVTPSGWSLLKAIQVVGNASFAGYSNRLYTVANAYFDGTNWKYIATDYANFYAQQTGQHQWYIAPSGTAGNTVTFTQAMTLDTSGNLLVGTTTGTTSGGYYFAVGSSSSFDTGHATGTASGTTFQRYTYAGSVIGSISQSGTTAVLYNLTSDARLKTNIVDAPVGNIDSIKVRSFDWKSDGSHVDYGFIAQELVEVAPYAVHQPQDSEEMMAVDYSKLVPMMIKEIQDLKQRIATLEAK